MLGRVLLGLANCCILRLWKCLKGSARLGQLLHPAVSQAPPRLGFGYRPGSADIPACWSGAREWPFGHVRLQRHCHPGSIPLCGSLFDQTIITHPNDSPDLTGSSFIEPTNACNMSSRFLGQSIGFILVSDSSVRFDHREDHPPRRPSPARPGPSCESLVTWSFAFVLV